MNDVKTHIMPGVTHWQHPNFFAFFPCNSSPPGLLGEMLSGMFNVVGFNWVCSPACTELETIVLDWMAKVCPILQNLTV
jgi:glutamate/tyrosine decarboxylase-like PLP-dependent enzyme